MRRSVMTTAAGCALAITVACGDARRASPEVEDQATVDDRGERDEQGRQPVTLTGCLQEGGGTLRRGYMLTMLNEPSGSVGTSGSSVTQTGSSVEREQMRIAARTYRLDPQGDLELDAMVGKQVRVTGVIVEEANVPNGSGAIGTSADTQRPNRDEVEQRREGARMSTADLAKMEVTSAAVTDEACGGPDNGRPSGTAPPQQ